MKLLTITEIKQRVSLPDYIGGLLDIKQQGREYRCLCPFHNDTKPSMQIYPDKKTGEWKYKCQPCGSGGDLFDFVKEYNGVDYKGAFEILSNDYQGLSEIVPRESKKPVDIYEDLEPIPLGDNNLIAGASFEVYNPKTKKKFTMTPTHTHKYEHGISVRWVIGGSKVIAMIRPCVIKSTGVLMWCMYPLRDHEFTFYGRFLPEGVVIVLEGEKTTDAAMEIFKGTPTSTICWSGGTNQVNQTDWSALADRKVILFPDNDSGGYKAMNYISQFLNNYKIVGPLDEVKGWDIADRPFTRPELIKYMEERYLHR